MTCNACQTIIQSDTSEKGIVLSVLEFELTKHVRIELALLIWSLFDSGEIIRERIGHSVFNIIEYYKSGWIRFCS